MKEEKKQKNFEEKYAKGNQNQFVGDVVVIYSKNAPTKL